MVSKNAGKGKGKNKGMDSQQNMFDFHFHFGASSAAILNLEGGNQEELSNFEFKFRQKLKEILEEVAKRETEPLDRVEVAARMTRTLGRDITKSNLDQWTALSAVQRRMHVDAMKAFCEVTGHWELMHFFVESCGFKALTPIEAKCAAFGANMALKEVLDGQLKDSKSALKDPALVEMLMNRMLKGKGLNDD